MSDDRTTQQITRIKKLQKKIKSEVGKAISDYNMI